MSASTKESFSGPAEILRQARAAAEKTHGKQSGSWSRWICEALREKLQRDGHAIPSEQRIIDDAVAEARDRGVDVVKELSRAARSKARGART